MPHWMWRMPKMRIMDEVICCAAPLSATSLPSIAPKPRMVTSDPSVLPIPLEMALPISGPDMPQTSASAILTIRKDMNVSSFTHKISTIRKRIAAMAYIKGRNANMG